MSWQRLNNYNSLQISLLMDWLLVWVQQTNFYLEIYKPIWHDSYFLYK